MSHLKLNFNQLKKVFNAENKVDYLTKQAVIAALYVVLTLVFAPLSFGPIQFRMSELIMLFILVDRRYITGLTLGVLVANIFSPLGIVDVIFGTSATLLALLVYILIATKSWERFVVFIVSLTLFNAIIVGFELTLVGIADNFLFTFLTVGLSELVLAVIAVIVYVTAKPILKTFRIK